MQKYLAPLIALATLLATASAQTALVLGGTVTGGAASTEALACITNGVAVEVVTDAGWLAKTQADFAGYRALILGDPTCVGPGVSPSIAAAVSNNTVWGPTVDGNTLIVGTDPVFHNAQGGLQFNNDSVAFVLADATKTGALLGLSCYYDSVAPGTSVPLLDQLPFVTPGAFTVTGVNCYNNVHITANHPALAGSTDATLSNWSCSVHEAFQTWQSTGLNPFLVLAIAQDLGAAYTAPDGTVGTPFILARGAGLVVDSDITLAPALTLCRPVNSPIKMTATVVENGAPVVGTVVTFTVIAGPSIGLIMMDATDVNGEASFTFSSAVPGVDTVVAQFVDSAMLTQTSNTAAVEWCEAECYLVIGRGGTGSNWMIGNTLFSTQLTSVRSSWVVTMVDYPSIAIPNLSSGSLSFSSQILMRNPHDFPQNPDQWSQRMRVTVQPGQVVTGDLFGTLNGIHIHLATHTGTSGNQYMSFPFQVEGM
jgi:hypothetical protein